MSAVIICVVFILFVGLFFWELFHQGFLAFSMLFRMIILSELLLSLKTKFFV